MILHVAPSVDMKFLVAEFSVANFSLSCVRFSVNSF